MDEESAAKDVANETAFRYKERIKQHVVVKQQ
jgi:hypothetical protein